MKSICRNIVALFFFAAWASLASAQDYVFESFRIGDSAETVPLDINNNDVVVGVYYESEEDFLGTSFSYTAGEYQLIDFPDMGIAEVEVSAINDAGEMVGSGVDEEAFSFVGFQVDAVGNFETFAAAADALITWPSSIDESSVVTGVAVGFDGDTIFRKDGDAIELISIPGIVELSIAHANGEGTIVAGGYREDESSASFIYRDGEFEEFTYPGGSAEVIAINNNGAIIGDVFFEDETASSFVFEGGEFRDIAFPGAEFTSVTGINDAGALVGVYSLPGLDPVFGFVARPVPEPDGLWAMAGLCLLTAVGRRRLRQNSALIKT